MVDVKQFVVYGDLGYSWRMRLEVSFSGAKLSDVQKAFNKAMTTVRTTLEW